MIKLDPKDVQDMTQKDSVDTMITQITKICDCIAKTESKQFDEKETFSQIRKYISNHDRLLYSEISGYVYQLNEETYSIFEVNISSLLRYVNSETFSQELEIKDENEQLEYRKARNAVIKFYDHATLAHQQYVHLKLTDSEYSKKFEEEILPFKAEVTKDMSVQLITLVGIFTAIAFVVFGGINSLSVIFTNIASVSLLRLIIIGTIWAVFLLNVVFVFMFCLQKFTNIDIRSNQKNNANIIQQYPIVWWSNLIMLFILFFSMNLYRCIHLTWIISESIIASSSLIVVVFAALVYMLIKCANTK